MLTSIYLGRNGESRFFGIFKILFLTYFIILLVNIEFLFFFFFFHNKYNNFSKIALQYQKINTYSNNLDEIINYHKISVS